MEDKEENLDFEELSARHQKLKLLASVATREYDELFKKYTEIQTQHEEVNKRLADSETQLTHEQNSTSTKEIVNRLEDDLAQMKAERDDAIAREEKLTSKCKRLETELGKLHEKVSSHQSMLNKLSRYSTLILDEFTEVKDGYEREFALKQAAELYACQMRTQRDASFRQSSVLLASAASDTRLMDAMLEIESLTKKHADELRESEEKIKSLEASLEISSDWNNIKKLEEKLDLSTVEIDRMRSEMEEMEKLKSEISAENSELKEKLMTISAGENSPGAMPVSTVPPPIAPPPPPIPACPTKLVITRSGSKPESPSNSLLSPKTPGDGKQLVIQDAMKEMMERIQSGKLLTGGITQKPSRPKNNNNSATAVNDLQQLLTKLKDRRKGSVDESIGSSSTSPASDVPPKVQPSVPVSQSRNINFTMPNRSPVQSNRSPVQRRQPNPYASGGSACGGPPSSSETSELEKTFNKIAHRGITIDQASSSGCNLAASASNASRDKRNAGIQYRNLVDNSSTNL